MFLLFAFFALKIYKIIGKVKSSSSTHQYTVLPYWSTSVGVSRDTWDLGQHTPPRPGHIFFTVVYYYGSRPS